MNELRSPEFQAAAFRIVLLHAAPFIEYWQDRGSWLKGSLCSFLVCFVDASFTGVFLFLIPFLFFSFRKI
jgi:hypothetical protein